jgi:hypothetical protein
VGCVRTSPSASAFRSAALLGAQNFPTTLDHAFGLGLAPGPWKRHLRLLPHPHRHNPLAAVCIALRPPPIAEACLRVAGSVALRGSAGTRLLSGNNPQEDGSSAAPPNRGLNQRRQSHQAGPRARTQAKPALAAIPWHR